MGSVPSDNKRRKKRECKKTVLAKMQGNRKYKLVQSLQKSVQEFLKAPKVELPLDPAVLLPGMYLKELRQHALEITACPCFAVTKFTIAEI